MNFSHIKLFIIFICISIVNIISTTHLISILLVGVIYYIFSLTLYYKEYYKLIWSILTFLVFEINFGFPLFSISLFSYFIYLVVVPYFTINLSLNRTNYITALAIFYIFFGLLVALLNDFTTDMILPFFGNYLLDTLVLAFIL